MDEKDAEILALRAELEQARQAKVDGGMGKLAAHAAREAAEYRTLMNGGDDNVPEIHDTAMAAAAHAFGDWLP